MDDRIVVLVDMDCFYCQVEARYNPSLKGKPMAVVQYNQWQGGGIIAVNYEARAFGVTRHIRGNEAKKKCPDIALVHVPAVRGKADLTRYRDAGREVVDVLCRFSDTVQRASVDEAYLDITQAVNMRLQKLNGSKIMPEQLPNTFIVGFSPEDSNDEDQRREGLLAWLNGSSCDELQDGTTEKLAVAALIVEEMRASVFESTGFRCSAGIAHNKILAKLACGLHKPQRQTVLPQSGVPILYRSLPIHKVRGLGGKFGDVVKQRLNINFMGDLMQFSENQLQKAFDEKSGSWLYNIGRGFDDEAVTSRLTSKSIGCCKKFPGKLALATKETVEHWLGELAEEVGERLEKELLEGNRRATQFVVSYMQTIDGRDVSSSRCGSLTSFEPKQMVTEAMELLKKSNTSPANSSSWAPPLKFLGLSAGKFVEKDVKNSSIESFFKSVVKKDSASHSEDTKNEDDVCNEVNININKITHQDECGELENCRSTVRNNTQSKEVKNSGGRSDEKDSSNKSSKNEDLDDTCVKSNIQNPTHKVMRKEQGGNSPLDSFFVRYFKCQGLSKTPPPSEDRKLFLANNALINKQVNNEQKTPTGATGKSQEPTTSDGYHGITDRSVRLLQVDDSSNDSIKSLQNWVSPREIFPNLDEVDDAVAALLPSPMQQQLRSRLQKHLEESDSKKSKDIAKIKSKKCLVYESNSVKSDAEGSTKDIEDKITVEDTAVNKVDICLLELNEDKKSHENLSEEDIFASCTPQSTEKEENELNIVIPTSGKQSELHVSNEICDQNLGNDCIEKLEEKCSKEAPKGDISNSRHENNQVCNTICVDETLKEVCPHCNQLVPLMEYPEHLDFHVAADLDQQLNRTPVNHSATHRNSSLSSGNSPKKENKRKRGKAGQKKDPPTGDKKMRSITNFFAPVR